MDPVLPTGSNEGRYAHAGMARLINCYAQSKPVDGFGPVALVRAPGIETVVDLNGEGRGLKVFGDGLYAIVGTSLYQIVGTDNATNLGSLFGTAVQLTDRDHRNRSTDPSGLCGHQTGRSGRDGSPARAGGSDPLADRDHHRR